MKQRIKQGLFLVLAGVCMAAWIGSAKAVVVVGDTWSDGTRTDPAAPTYSEQGTDSDFDGDIESAWFKGNAGAFDPVGPGGPLRLTQDSASSTSLTTYFTAEGSEVSLNATGDSVRMTWKFQVSGAAPTTANNSSQGVRIAFVDSPSASRVSSNASPGSAAYTGYGIFLNMDATLNRTDPFTLMRRHDSDGALLSSSGEWDALADDGTDGAVGYVPGNLYTLTLMLTRAAGGALDIYASMAGGNIDDDGLMEISYTDPSPSPLGGYKFDTFEFRPDGNDVSYNIIDSYLFKVEYPVEVPEPASVGLLLSGLALVFTARRGRKPR
jgi:PEP-CTERM motif